MPMPSVRQTLEQVRELPRTHQALFWLSTTMVIWQALYLVRYSGDFLYSVFERPVSPPSLCEEREAPREKAEGMKPGEVLFSVDMRCTKSDYQEVFVTSPICGECGPEGWNTLKDEDGDGIYEGKVQFTNGEDPMVGVGILYRYGISSPEGEGSWPEVRVSYPENLLAAQLAEGGVSCAPASDGMTYAYRVIDTDRDGSEVTGIFGSCTAVPISEAEWAKVKEHEWEKANPFLDQKIDPWWGPLSAFLRGMEVMDPILFLTFCTIVYIYSILIIGSGYVRRKEKALGDALAEANHKNTYLEHAAKILRHDMHSGINTYIPRGISSLERRLEKEPDSIERLRLAAPLRMLKEGLAHAQKVYRGVTEFTNLVKAGGGIEKQPHALHEILRDYLDTTGYKSDVVLNKLPTIEVNAPLFCTAVDNLIRNGLKYNDSPSRMVIVTMVSESVLGILDNGRGMSHEEFLEYSKPYKRKAGQTEPGSGLGLNICIAILHEHGFTVSAEKREEGGTLIKVKLK